MSNFCCNFAVAFETMELRNLSDIFPSDYSNPPSEEQLRRTCHEVTDLSSYPIDVIDYLEHILCPKKREATATVLYQCIQSGEIQVNSFEREGFLFRLGSVIRAAKIDAVQKAMKTVDEAVVSPNPQETVAQTIPTVTQMEKDVASMKNDVAWLMSVVTKMVNEEAAWPYYTEKANLKDKEFFEKQLRKLCVSNKRSATKDLKNYLALKVSEGIIKRPTQTNDEWEILKLFGYTKAQKTYYNS